MPFAPSDFRPARYVLKVGGNGLTVAAEQSPEAGS